MVGIQAREEGCGVATFSFVSEADLDRLPDTEAAKRAESQGASGFSTPFLLCTDAWQMSCLVLP